jgi:hypothetical protein
MNDDTKHGGNMKTKLFYSLLITAALVPTAAHAQSATAAATSDAQTQVRTPKARIDAAMQAAARADIPVSLLQNKVAEGTAKNVPQERVAAAVEARLHTLIRASRALQRADVEAASQSELAVSADALEAGVSEGALIKISRSAPAERRAVAVATLSGLVQLGHASERALARVSAVLGSNAALANLQAEVASQLQLGGAANANAGGIIRIN